MISSLVRVKVTVDEACNKTECLVPPVSCLTTSLPGERTRESFSRLTDSTKTASEKVRVIVLASRSKENAFSIGEEVSAVKVVTLRAKLISTGVTWF